MKDLELTRDAVNRITDVAETIEEVINRKEAWLDDYIANGPEDLHTSAALARRMLIDMLSMNINELKRIRDHLLAP